METPLILFIVVQFFGFHLVNVRIVKTLFQGHRKVRMSQGKAFILHHSGRRSTFHMAQLYVLTQPTIRPTVNIRMTIGRSLAQLFAFVFANRVIRLFVVICPLCSSVSTGTIVVKHVDTLVIFVLTEWVHDVVLVVIIGIQ